MEKFRARSLVEDVYMVIEEDALFLEEEPVLNRIETLKNSA
jgi:hypothetical protein